MNKIAFILGTRPEILKLMPIIKEIPEEQREIIWTGQHYSPELAEAWWAEEGFKPDIECCYGDDDEERHPCNATNAMRLAEMIAEINAQIVGFSNLHWVVVQGDTDSALAGALAAAKLNIPVFHVEAGSRSGDSIQPEEINRKLIDHCASGWAAAYPWDMDNLQTEGIGHQASDNVIMSGDTLIDGLKEWEAKVNPKDMPGESWNILATIHRAETLNNKQALSEIFSFLDNLAMSTPVVLLAHPHLWQAASDNLLAFADYKFQTRDALPPSEFRKALMYSKLFITDSGGAATEAAYFGVPTIIARDNLELHDLENCGRIILGGRTQESLSKAMLTVQSNAPLSLEVKQAWHGQAGKLIAERLLA
mgnify:CR=1 FL=1